MTVKTLATGAAVITAIDAGAGDLTTMASVTPAAPGVRQAVLAAVPPG